MEITAYVITTVFGLVWGWLNVLASVAVRHDVTLERFQKVAQLVIVWAVPYLGSAFVLHLIWQQYPDAIPNAWVPWPFKNMIYGKPPLPNQNRDEESWVPISGGKQSHHVSGGFGGEGGGSSD